VLAAHPERRVIEFHVPSRRRVEMGGYITTCTVTWVHPDVMDEEALFANKDGTPMGPNFWVTIDTTDVGDEMVDDLETVDDLVWWLKELQEADVL
jgi:hypothetical protein